MIGQVVDTYFHRDKLFDHPGLTPSSSLFFIHATMLACCCRYQRAGQEGKPVPLDAKPDDNMDEDDRAT